MRSDFWVAAYIRRVNQAGAFATLRRRGADEAGAIWLILERNRDEIAFYAPAPQSLISSQKNEHIQGIDRCFTSVFDPIWRNRMDVEAKLAQEIKFDSDLFVIEIEDREGRIFADILAQDTA